MRRTRGGETTRKGRPCKYGERIDGKCPPKPKNTTAKKTRKERPCKYGPRVNGKCPSKPKAKTVKSIHILGDKVDVEIMFYENGLRSTFDTLSGEELSSVTDRISDILGVYDEDIEFRGEEEERMIVKNVKYNNEMIGDRLKKYKLNEKIPVTLEQYGVKSWGKTEVVFVPV